MESYETVYYVTGTFEGNEEEVATNYVVEESIVFENNETVENQVLETNKDAENNISVERMEIGEDQVILVKDDGRVVIVNKEGDESAVILGHYVQSDENYVVCNKDEENSNVNETEEHQCQPEREEDSNHNTTQRNCSHNEVERAVSNLNREVTDTENESRDAEEETFAPSNENVLIVNFKDRPKKRVAKVVKGVNKITKLHIEKCEEGPVVDKLTCKYCLKSFTKSSNKQRHIRTIHNIKKNLGTDIRCIECDICFKHVTSLRAHLTSKHNLIMTEENLSFPNMNAFMKWKCEIERKNLCSYTLRHGSRKTTNGPKHFYMCHRSGRYEPKLEGERRRMLRVAGTCKLGIVCTAAIYCQECPNEVRVKYVPHHYGHGKETSFVQLSPEEQTAIQESVSNGVPFEKLLDEIRDMQSKDTFQLLLLKKRDFRWINAAYKAEEYNPGISDAESVQNWVQRCCQMEDSPVLYYKQQNIGCEQEEFMLVIMTEFQKHILLSSSKEVVCVDSMYRRKGLRFYLTVMFVMDEFDIAFPVAFCISNKIDKNVIQQFFLSIKESTGNISAKCFMSDSEPYFYDAWVSVMNDEPRWLWCIWYVDSKIRTQLRIFKGNIAKRAEVYKSMRILLECQNENLFLCMFKNFIDGLNSSPYTKELGKFILNKYGSNTELWASCYRKEVDFSTTMHLEVMHRTFRYCCREGRKKRLDKFLFVVMKLIKCKMLDRIANMLDEEKLNMAIEAINMCHTAAIAIPTHSMSALSENIWLIETEDAENPVYVTKEIDKCPEHCNLRCEECDICVHQYSCSCVHSMIDANLCMHIHAVVWKFLTPHFSPPGSPTHSIGPMNDDIDDTPIFPDQCPDLFEAALKRTHDVYRKMKGSRCSLNKDSLTSVIKRLNECIDICSGKLQENNELDADSPIPLSDDTMEEADSPVKAKYISPSQPSNSTQQLQFQSPKLACPPKPSNPTYQSQPSNPTYQPQPSNPTYQPQPSNPIYQPQPSNSNYQAQPSNPTCQSPSQPQLTNQFPTILPNNGSFPQYVILLPNSGFIANNSFITNNGVIQNSSPAPQK